MVSVETVSPIVEGLQRRGRYADLSPILADLRRRGWTDERLAKNDLGAPNPDFWRTIGRLAGELAAEGLRPIFIKCVREYPYTDSNVDLLVPRDRMRSVARRLIATDWCAPTPWDRVEQVLIERAKLKLPSRTPGLLTAHLYGGVSWRYQRDLGMLSSSPEAGNPGLVATSVADLVDPSGPSVEYAQSEVLLPADSVEPVLQAAHVVFENYRITVGEALHFQLLRARSPESWAVAHSVAERIGCGVALELMDRVSREVCDGLPGLDPAEYPRTLSAEQLSPAFRARARSLRREGALLGAFHEWWTAAAVFRLVRTIRRARRRRRGVEDYR